MNVFKMLVCRAIKIVDTDNEPLVESSQELSLLADMRVKCCNNLAAAQLKVSSQFISS
jgi:hypothetical protein